jgi:hypothetical protein
MTAKNPWQNNLKSLENDDELIQCQNPLSVIRDFLISWPGEETVKLDIQNRHNRLMQIICGYPEIDVNRYPLDWPLSKKASKSFGLTLFLDNITSPNDESSLRDVLINMSYNSKNMIGTDFISAHRRIIAILFLGIRSLANNESNYSSFTLEEQKLLITLHSNSASRVNSCWPIEEMELSLDRNNFYVPTFRSTTVAKKSICQFWSDNSDLNEPKEFSTYEVKLHKIQNWIKKWSNNKDSFQIELISGASAILENIMSSFRRQIIDQFGVESIIIDGGGRLIFIGDKNLDIQFNNTLKNMFSISDGVMPKFNHELTKLAYLLSGKEKSERLNRHDYDLIYGNKGEISNELRNEVIIEWIKINLPDFIVKENYDSMNISLEPQKEREIVQDCIICNQAYAENLELEQFLNEKKTTVCNFHLLLLLIGRSKRLVDSTTKEKGKTFAFKDNMERKVRAITRLDLNSLGILFTRKYSQDKDNTLSITRRRSIRFNCQWWRILFQSLDHPDIEIDRIVAWVAAGDDLIIADYGGSKTTIRPQRISNFLEILSSSLDGLSKREYGDFKLSFGAGISSMTYTGSHSVSNMLKSSKDAENNAKSIWKRLQDNEHDRWLIINHEGKIKSYQQKAFDDNEYQTHNNSVFYFSSN